MRLLAILDTLLLPSGLPDRPWTHAPYRATLSTMDAASLVVTFVINGAVIAKSHRFLNIPFWERNAVPLIIIVQSLLQGIWLRWWPASYFRSRHHMLFISRCSRVAFALQVPLSIRHWLATTATPARDIAVFAAGPDPARPPGWAAPFNLTMMLSGSLHALSSSVNWPLPLRPQLLLQASYVIVLTLVAAKPAAACLALAPFPRALQHACTSANHLLASVVFGFGGADLDMEAAEQLCRTDAALLLPTFCIWFFAGVLPLLSAHRVEQHVARCVARGALAAGARLRGPAPECDDEDREGGGQRSLFGAASVLVNDCVVLFLAAGVIWLGLLMWLPVLADHMQPM